MAETKYNLLTRLLKDLRNQVSSSGDIGGKSNGGTLVVHSTYDEVTNIETIDASFNDIHDAVEYGKVVMLVASRSIVNVGFQTLLIYLTNIGHNATLQSRNYFVAFGEARYFADSPDVLMDSSTPDSQAEHPPEDLGGTK